MKSKVASNRWATIDVGTNSVILFVCEIDPKSGSFVTIHDDSEILRLGEGIEQTRRIKKSAASRTAATIKSFSHKAQQLGVPTDQIRAIGTSVFRQSDNSDDVLNLVKKLCDIDIEVISGSREAELSYLAVCSDEIFRSHLGENLVVTDVGGGSTELIYHQNGVQYNSRPIGAVYGTDRFFKNDPPQQTEIEAFSKHLETVFADHPPPENTSLVGIGGTMVNLGSIKVALQKLDQDQIHGQTLSLDEIEHQIQLFQSCTINDRAKIPGLDPKRADVILGGAVIVRHLMQHFGTSQISVSTKGIRNGLITDQLFPDLL